MLPVSVYTQQYMEQVHNNSEQVATPENFKKTAFAEVMRSVLFRFNQEKDTISTFAVEGKQFSITSTAGGVKALGQLPSSTAQTIYKEVISKK